MERKILKENIEAIILPLSYKFLGIEIKSSKRLKEKFQITQEREPDFIRLITDNNDEEFILHLEFQTTDEREVDYRMLEYYGFFFRRFKKSIRQFVLYLGEAPLTKMHGSLKADTFVFQYQLINIKEYRHEDLLKSEIPEEIILAVLANFSNQPSEHVIRSILQRLQAVSKTENTLRKYIRQLGVLSRLRKLEDITLKEVKAMPITYDFKTDYLYLEGKKEMIVELLKEGSFSVKKIAKLAKVDVKYVREIEKAIEK